MLTNSMGEVGDPLKDTGNGILFAITFGGAESPLAMANWALTQSSPPSRQLSPASPRLEEALRIRSSLGSDVVAFRKRRRDELEE